MPRLITAMCRRLAHRLPCLLALALGAAPLPAQDIIRSAASWHTLRTRWFDVHYPTDTEAWAQELAPRLDAMRDAVTTLVGYAPNGRTTVVIDDPYNVANGKAIPILGAPVIHLWVTPPSPTDQIANHRGWATKLAAHEFGHIAHLSRPARRMQWYWHLLPAQVSPLALFTPRWAIEGYATWIEGQITGSGRPHGAWRPALLRELALAGRLPSYAAMSAGGGYKGGSMAYLAGSAFWEWLAAQRGDTSMTLVFRRQSARTARSFDDAFRGVYGDAPATLYARFSAELTSKAFRVDSSLRQRGLVQGTLLARYPGGASGLAVSYDGKRVALVLPGQGASPRVIVAPLDTQPVTTLERQQVTRQLRRDPQDVAAVRVYPRLAKPIATLTARRGRTFRNPRFIGASPTLLLVESWSTRRDGTQRPDLAIWNTESGDVRFVTDGAGVQDADPAPSGKFAAAVRCLGGSCGLVLVSLSTGVVTPLTNGSPTRVFSHPRFPPVNDELFVSVQDGDGVWRLAWIDLRNGRPQIFSPDDGVNRHSPSFDYNGGVLYVSEAGGIPNAESTYNFAFDRPRRARTRVLGSVYEPVALPDGGLLFLSEYAGGMELRRTVRSDSVRGELATDADLQLIPAMPRPRDAGITLAERPIPAPTPYGIGPRTHRLMAQTALGRDGLTFAGVLAGTDPANRFTYTLTGMAGTTAAWRGGVASAAWYGTRPVLRAEAAWLEQRAAAQKNRADVSAADLRLAGGSLAAELPIAGTSVAQRMAISGFIGAAANGTGDATLRTTLSAQYAVGAVVGWRRSIGASLRTTVGRLADSSFARASLGANASLFRTRLDVRWHGATKGTPQLEQFSAGGFAPPLADAATLGQRLAMPAFPVGITRGVELYDYRLARPAPVLPVTLYAQSTGSAWRADRHSAVVGIETAFDIDYLGLVGLPRLQALAGVARIVRGPLRDKGSAYFSLGWRP